MPSLRLFALVAVLAPLASLACGGPPDPAVAPVSASASHAVPAPAAGGPAEGPVGEDAGTVSGTVAETMNSGGYTYARLTNDGRDVWMAAPEDLSIAVGDRLTGTVSMPMEHFRSRTLNREFDLIYFVNRVTRNGEVVQPAPAPAGGMTMAGSHGAGGAAEAPPSPVAPVDPAPGGLTVADVWQKREALSGSTVTVRARVVKANYGIMGVNWYHLQDGSGSTADGTNDLTVTSDAQARVGDVVTISGTLVTKKDYGAGYAYAAIVERATVSHQAQAQGR
jgi:hypothetical protein